MKSPRKGRLSLCFFFKKRKEGKNKLLSSNFVIIARSNDDALIETPSLPWHLE